MNLCNYDDVSLSLDIARSESEICRLMVAYRTGPADQRMAEWRRYREASALNLALVAHREEVE